MKNVILIGMPGCGKSTVGVLLAKELGFRFTDTDLLICEHENSTLQDIIDRKGVDELLRIESLIGEALKIENTVVATGGSMVFSESAMKNLKNQGIVVFIKVSLENIKARINNLATRGVAMREGETLDDVYEQRMPKYEEYADITVHAHAYNSIDNVVEKIKILLARQ